MKAVLYILLCVTFTSYAQDIRNLEVEAIINGIAKDNVYDSEGIGIGGKKSNQRSRYDRLRDKATIEELVAATSHQNPVVRCYAFEALVEKKDTSTCQILLHHLSDTSIVSTHMGCLLGSTSVKYFILRLYNLHSKQFQDIKGSIDSFVLSDIEQEPSNLPLEIQHQNGQDYKRETLIDLEPKPEYYQRLKTIYDKKSNIYPTLIVPIAKYNNLSDTSLILSSLKGSNEWNLNGLLASIELPHSSYLPILTKQLREEMKQSYPSHEYSRLLLLSLGNHEKPETIILFQEVLSLDDFDYKVVLYDAISNKPYFKDVLDQIDF